MNEASVRYHIFVLVTILTLVLAAVPIIVSDVFRRPYSPVWPTIHRTLARLDFTVNPPGGGAPPQLPTWRDPADAFLYYRNVRLVTADGVELEAWYVPSAEPGAPTLLLAHGLHDSKWWMLHLVPWLHDAGYNAMLFDFRGHGQSDPRPTTVGPEEVLDVQAALDWLEDEGVGDRVVGLGMSMGAAALVNTAVEDDRLDGLILDSMFAEWSEVDYTDEYYLPPEWLVPGVPNPVELVPRIHVPILIIHGTADIMTHVDHARRLYAAANEPKELWINDSGHAWSAWTYPEVYREKVLHFLDAVFDSRE